MWTEGYPSDCCTPVRIMVFFDIDDARTELVSALEELVRISDEQSGQLSASRERAGETRKVFEQMMDAKLSGHSAPDRSSIESRFRQTSPASAR